ncbi:cryptococcal mannosyltransferase 1-domain-containing protein, partial [Mycena olivaceomarginata]
ISSISQILAISPWEPLVIQGVYDHVLLNNNVFVEAESIIELLNTKGSDYDMACGLDFYSRGLYDLWVLHDRLRHLASALGPYFLADTGFRAVMTDEPIPVFACWNGIIAMRTLSCQSLSARASSPPFC